MGSDFKEALPYIAMAAGFCIGGPAGAGAAGGWSWSGAMMGAAYGGMVGQMAQSAFGGDPMAEIRAGVASNLAQQQKALDAWMQQQQKLWDVQNKQIEQIKPIQEEFTSQFGDILSGKRHVEDMPMFASMFGNLRQAEHQARQKAMEQIGQPGARQRALEAIGQQYADARAKLAGDISRWVYEQAGRLQLPYQAPSAGSLPSMDLSGVGALGQMKPQGVDPALLYMVGKELGGPGTPKGRTGQRTVLNDYYGLG